MTGEGKGKGEDVGESMDLDHDDENILGGGKEGESQGEVEELEILEIVRWKIVFSSRPEPFGEEGVD